MIETATTLLIVEDDPEDRMMLSKALNDVGFEGEVEFCEDGRELIERIRSGGEALPSLVLLDLEMPRMGGLEALSALRGERGEKSLPVIVVTSSTLPSDVKSAYELGANAYIRKPGRMAELREVMKTLTEFWFNIVTLPRRHPA